MAKFLHYMESDSEMPKHPLFGDISDSSCIFLNCTYLILNCLSLDACSIPSTKINLMIADTGC